MNRFYIIMALLVMLALSVDEASAVIWYVSPGGTGSGTSWADASADLRNVILLSSAGDEIWVAEGIYKPDPTNRNRSFKLRNGVGVYGGFDGTEILREERNFVSNRVYLSGDLLDDDGVDFTNRDDNSFRVVESIGSNAATVLDGFEIRGGHAFDPVKNSGAGIYLEDSELVLRNCIITKNDAMFNGGGLYAPNPGGSYHSDPNLEFVFFADNYAGQNGGGMSISSSQNVSLAKVSFLRNEAEGNGGGLDIYNSNGVVLECRFVNNSADNGGAISVGSFDMNTVFSRCILKKNKAESFGGAMYVSFADPEITTVLFQKNEAGINGGGLYAYGDEVSISGCGFFGNEAGARGGGAWLDIDPAYPVVNAVFLGNYAQDYGGGLFNDSYPSLDVINSSFSGNNTSGPGGAICSGFLNQTDVYNSILWGNSSEMGALGTISSPVIYSCVQGGYPGIGNTALDPLFMSEPVFSTAPTVAGDLRPSDGSPAIDNGNDAVVPVSVSEDVLGNNRFMGAVDMGAYEFPFTFRMSNPDDAAGITITQTSDGIYINLLSLTAETVSMVNSSGQMVKMVEGPKRGTLHISNSGLASGIYYVVVRTNGETISCPVYLTGK